MVMRAVYIAAVLVLLVALFLQKGAGSGQTTTQHAGTVLSAVLGDHVEVVRGWPQNPVDVQVYPFAPHSWNGCAPGQGAIVTLITAPVDLPPSWAGLSAYYDPQRRVEAVISGHLVSRAKALQEHEPALSHWLWRLVTPGDPAWELMKMALPEVRSMGVYEKYGYAVFLLLKWEWRFPLPGCYPTLISVPEGYGIPFVR